MHVSVCWRTSATSHTQAIQWMECPYNKGYVQKMLILIILLSKQISGCVRKMNDCIGLFEANGEHSFHVVKCTVRFVSYMGVNLCAVKKATWCLTMPLWRMWTSRRCKLTNSTCGWRWSPTARGAVSRWLWSLTASKSKSIFSAICWQKRSTNKCVDLEVLCQ